VCGCVLSGCVLTGPSLPFPLPNPTSLSRFPSFLPFLLVTTIIGFFVQLGFDCGAVKKSITIVIESRSDIPYLFLGRIRIV